MEHLDQFPPFVFYFINQTTYRTFTVIKESCDDIEEYYVRYDHRGFRCSCKASAFRHVCKHIMMVKEYMVNGKKRFEEEDRRVPSVPSIES